ncbi:hypothetical protein [Thiomicrorhabdus sp.]|uniref:hypothetical protein n=1 Tax=Thiomicrorhabdus sp. TaxID=2039724 RepID=UPI0029C81C2C|nr:hypothetical protein [Thiomicrorhabdus sp.]
MLSGKLDQVQLFKSELGDSWYFFRNHYGMISNLVLIPLMPIMLLDVFFSHYSSDGFFSFTSIASTLQIFAYCITSVAVIFYMSSVINGSPIARNKAWELGAVHFFRYLIFFYIYTFMSGVGLLLLVVPGLVVMARLSFTPFFMLIYDRKVMESFRMSWVMTKGPMWRLIFGFVLIYVVLSGVTGGLSALVPNAESSNFFQDLLLGIAFVLFIVFEKFSTVFSFRVFDQTMKEALAIEN